MISDVLAPWESDDIAPPKLVTVTEDGTTRIAHIEESNGERRLVFRGMDDDGSWTVAHGTPFFLPVFKSRTHVISLNAMRTTVRDARFRGTICRFRSLAHNGSVYRLSIAASGIGVCQGYGGTTPFSLGCEIGELLASQTRIKVESDARNPKSSLGFTLHFHRLSHDEKLRCLFGFPNEAVFHEALRELENVMRHVLRSDLPLWEGERDEYQWPLWAHAKQDNSTLSIKTRDVDVPASSRITQWSQILRQYGPLRPTLDYIALEHFWDSLTVLARVSVHSPTMHEKLEARLELHEWAQEHLPPDVRAEIERLGH